MPAVLRIIADTEQSQIFPFSKEIIQEYRGFLSLLPVGMYLIFHEIRDGLQQKVMVFGTVQLRTAVLFTV